jgi:hypothetical protein
MMAGAIREIQLYSPLPLRTVKRVLERAMGGDYRDCCN